MLMFSSEAWFALALLCVIWGVVSGVMIAAALHKRGVRVPMLFLNVVLFKYLGQYRAITLKETGRVGALFYCYIAAMNLAALAGITGIVVRAVVGT
jgi:hypothetical protein